MWCVCVCVIYHVLKIYTVHLLDFFNASLFDERCAQDLSVVIGVIIVAVVIADVPAMASST